MNFPRLCRSMAAPVALALFFAGPAPGRAQETAPDVSAGTSAYRDSIGQDELRADTERVRQELAMLLDELQQSQGATVERIQIQDALQKLGTLSEKDMAAVVQSLRDAGSQGNADAVQSKLLSASQGQKNIQVLLRTLSDRLARQRSQAAMQARLQALVLRQTVNLREAKVAAAEVQAHGLSYGPKQAAVFLGGEQNAIQQELAQALDAMRQMVANPSAAQDARGAAAALKESADRQLPDQAAAAATNTVGAKFPEATAAQQTVLDGMQAMLVRLDATLTMPERLQQMAAQTRDLASEQKQLAESTRTEFSRAAEGAARQDLRERQQRLTDRATAMHEEIAALNADAAGQLRDAGASMNSATGTLQQHYDALRGPSAPQKSKNGTPLPLNYHASVVKNQDEASGKLDQLGATLEKQADALAAATPPAPPSAEQTLADLQQLSQKVDQALDQQKGLNAKPDDADNAARQKQLADTTTGLQKDAATVSPQASGNLGEAADQMRQAAPPAANKPAPSGKPAAPPAPSPGTPAGAAAQPEANPAPANPPPATPPPAAQKAEEQLAQASTAIHQQVESLKQAITDAQHMDKMISQLGAAKEQTAQASEAMQHTPADATQQTETAEHSLQQVQADAQNAPFVPPEAKENMQKAAQHLGESKLHAAEPQRTQAMAANAKAQDDIDHAMKKLQEAKEEAIAAAMPGAPMLAQEMPHDPQAGQQKPGNDRSGPDTDSKGLLDNKPTGSGGPAQTVGGLKPKDRDAILLLEKEVPPAEYSSMVSQYTKNLSDGDSPETELP